MSRKFPAIDEKKGNSFHKWKHMTNHSNLYECFQLEGNYCQKIGKRYELLIYLLIMCTIFYIFIHNMLARKLYCVEQMNKNFVEDMCTEFAIYFRKSSLTI